MVHNLCNMQKQRRAARELALNLLYQVDVTRIPLDEAVETARENADVSIEAFEYAEKLARGVRTAKKDLDKVIRRLSKDWPLARQPAVDRNILRIAVFELWDPESTPAAVVVNEAVELAKKFSTADSGKFINGVLATCIKELETGAGPAGPSPD